MEWLKPILLPAVGAFLGVIAKEAIDRNRSKKQMGVSDVEFLGHQIDEIRELAVTYWSKASNEESKLIEARITGMLHGCVEIIAASNLKSKKYKKKLNEQLRQFRKICTSGSFGQITRMPDIDRLAEIEVEGRILYSNILSFRR
ncbi:hypothetical protein [Paracoccus sp. (in: a-proteobacteria)]|uniref:hypothetical protein n=1 Tax=Paracoccus sp. TaxID=267 RepID=UPI002AFE76BF|nr:hypothetical protein [Paracoccus sp. (in: a-proteobacteria)]